MTTAMEEWKRLTSKSIATGLASNIIRSGQTGKKPTKTISLNIEARIWLATGRVPSRDKVKRILRLSRSNNDFYTSKTRIEFIKEFGFPIPCLELIEAIKAEGPSVELGAGSGYLAALVNKCGGHVTPTDSYEGKYPFEISFHMKVHRLAASTAVKKFSNIPVLISWPGYQDKWPSRVANMLKPGSRLLYIGENGGYTARYSFEIILRKKFREIKSVSIPQWDGIHDYLRIFEKE